MLKFRLFGFPVVVDWWFWLVAALLCGGARAQGPHDWSRVVTGMAVVFLSILVHELGHAFAGKKFGAHPSMKLHGFGGLTFLPGARFSRVESIIVSAAGPLAGLGLWLILLLIEPRADYLPRLGREALRWGLQINLVWSLFNLLPIQPMDGGQILREVLGPRRTHITARLGGTLAVILAIWMFLDQQLINSVMLAVLAYYNFRHAPMEGGVIKG